MKTITFILPCLGRNPSGGFKIIYEYANSFASAGFQVYLLFDASHSMERFHFPELIRKTGCEILNYIYPQWFKLNSVIQKRCIFGITNQNVPNADFVVATAIETAFPTVALSEEKGVKLYFIQDFEEWGSNTKQTVMDSYRLGMKNIVISRWLEQLVAQSTNSAPIYIPNFVNTDVFDIDCRPEKRKVDSIAMLCADGEYKGTKYGLEAIKRLKKSYPDLEVNLFGTLKRVEGIESWMTYHFNAGEKELRQIYNRASIYLYPAVKEGWGLTGMESMACGCAYVASDYGGVREYTIPDVNALISPPCDIDGLVSNVSSLIDYKGRGVELAYNGYHHIQKKFSKNESFQKFLNAVNAVNAGE